MSIKMAMRAVGLFFTELVKPSHNEAPVTRESISVAGTAKKS